MKNCMRKDKMVEYYYFKYCKALRSVTFQIFLKNSHCSVLLNKSLRVGKNNF